MSSQPSTKSTGTAYQYGVTATWLITLGAYAAIIYLIPIQEPVDKTLMWDGILGLFGASCMLGSAGHFCLRFVFRRKGEGHVDPAAHPKRQLLAGLIWVGLLGLILFLALSFVFAVWAAV